MAVTFHYNIEVLIRDFQRRGLKPEIVRSVGHPARAMEIRVGKAVIVHWDADSRSVWAEGPWPEIERLERSIRRRFYGGWRKRLRHSKKLIRYAFLGLAIVMLGAVCLPSARNRLATLLMPVVELPKEPTASNEPATASRAATKPEAQPQETEAAP